MMEYLKIATLLALAAAALLMMYWLFRPGAKRFYNECSMIPLQSEDQYNKQEERR
jgi:cbb3-type cytochrome oxidase subunit 3